MEHLRLFDQIEHLEDLIEVYGDVLIAWELREPPDRIVPVLAEAGRLDTSQVQTLLEEILIGGGARLFTEFHRIEAAAKQSGDTEALKAVERVREALLHIGRYNADALAWGMGTAMYRAKSSVGGGSEVFDDQMRQQALKALEMQTALRRGFDRDEFSLVYEPIMLLQTNQVVGFEALARWIPPDGRSIPPSEFIPLAEETGLIIAMGNWALGEACRQLQRWLAAYPARTLLWISVNLSRRQLAHVDLIHHVSRLLQETGAEPSRLMLEITENTIMQNVEDAARTLATIKAMGVRIALDDFGTGYSSLSLLQRFPIDVVKIDRSFVRELDTTSSDGSKVLRAITSLATSLGLDVVAEGVEQRDQIALLQELGCKYGQGHYFSRPQDAVSATKLLDDRQTTIRG
jgi:EAL domain-containing protein (putative c-di-GMP-specific phosphodiesterase class I)